MESKTLMRKPLPYAYIHTSLCAILACICILFSSIPNYAGADTWYPPGNAPLTTEKSYPLQSRAAESRDELNPLVQGVRFFQKFISPVDSPRCPMYPTCSSYALQALHRHGSVLGSFLTVDRLLHETSPAEQTIPLEGFERIRYYDPLEANDFWLESAKSPVGH
jgi:putative membrane protein insertion efficiency factor